MPYFDREYYVKEVCENNEQNGQLENGQLENWKIKLKNHQLSLINKCIDLENNGIDKTIDDILDSKYEGIKTNIGIIGDKVGSGKSFVVLGIISLNKSPQVKFKHTQMYGLNNINVELKDRSNEFNKIPVNIIVVPHSIIKQWETCIKVSNKSFKYFIVNTTKSFNQLSTKINEIDILLISGTFYKKVQDYVAYNDIIVNRVFFDEVDSMNTPSARHIHAGFYWFVSASYKNVLNPYPRWNYEYRMFENSYLVSSGISNNIYVKNIFTAFYKTKSIILNRLIDSIVMKNSDDYVEQSFNLPEINRHTIKCRDSHLISVLNGVVHSNIINCLNAGDLGQAISYINQDNVDTEDNIINAVKQNLNIKLNNIKAEMRLVEDSIYANDEIKQRKKLKLLSEETCITNKMKLIEERISKSSLCMICLEPPENKAITKCCQNSFCLNCLTTWCKRKNNCPLCKHTLNIKEDVYITFNKDRIKVKQDPTKLQALQKFLINKFNENSKVLIFSDYDNSFNEIEGILNGLSINYARLRGNSINKNVEKYKNENLQILLINSSNYGSGLNLENTSDLIMFHKFENELETQVIGRAQRLGRKDSLNVHYLLNNNEIERSKSK